MFFTKVFTLNNVKILYIVHYIGTFDINLQVQTVNTRIIINTKIHQNKCVYI